MPSLGVTIQNQTAAIPVTSTAATGSFTDRSGTITAGGTRQQVMPANSSRKYLLVENVSDTDMWVDFGTNAVASQPSILLKANGGTIVMESAFVNTDRVDVMCATTGKAYTAKEA